MIPFRSPVARFVAGGDLFVGANALVALRATAATRVALVLSRSLTVDEELISLMERAIGAATCERVVCPSGEPDFVGAKSLAGTFQRLRPDWIVAVGGGSIIDLARVGWLLYEHPSVESPTPGRRMSIPKLRGLSRFAAVPCTVGAGAEVSSSVVLRDDRGAKLPLVSPEFLPDLVILDPRVTRSVPDIVLQHALGDVLSHFVEGAVSRTRNPMVSQLLSALFPTLLRTARAGVPHAAEEDKRTELMLLGLYGGWIQNHRPPGLGHAVAHQLARLDVPHSVASAVCLAATVRANAVDRVTEAKYQELACAAGITGGALALASELDDVISTLVANTPALAGKIAAMQKDLVNDAVSDLLCRNNPIPVTAEMIASVLADIR